MVSTFMSSHHCSLHLSPLYCVLLIARKLTFNVLFLTLLYTSWNDSTRDQKIQTVTAWMAFYTNATSRLYLVHLMVFYIQLFTILNRLGNVHVMKYCGMLILSIVATEKHLLLCSVVTLHWQYKTLHSFYTVVLHIAVNNAFMVILCHWQQ